MWNDVRYALRAMRRSPVFTVVAIASMALGIGANTAIFSLLNQVMLRMLPVAQPERLVVFHTEGQREGWSSTDNSEAVFSYPMYKNLRERNQVFEGVIARSSSPVSLLYGGVTERARAEMVSGNFFDVLGVRAVLGRLLTPEDDGAPGAHPVVVLSQGYWKRRFGADPKIVGQKVNINQHPMVVTGVAPAGFHGVLSGATPDVLVPIAMRQEMAPNDERVLDNHLFRWLNVFARLKPGVSREQAGAATDVLYRAVSAEELAHMKHTMDQRGRERYLGQKLELRPAAQGINSLRDDWETPLVALMAMVGLVLLIACANVANLLLVRAAGRKKEIAIRLAMGAPQWVIARQFLVESLMVALAGGVAGLVVANWTTGGLLSLLPDGENAGWLTTSLDLRTLVFSFGLVFVTALLFGLAPAIESTRARANTALKEQAASLSSAGGQTGVRRGFIVAQVALSLVLLVSAGLFTRSFYRLMTEDPGFQAENLLRFSVDPGLNGYDLARGLAFYRDLQQRLAVVPGALSVGATSMGPFGHGQQGLNITVEGYKAGDDEVVGASRDGVSPNYFRTMRIQLMEGREFTERDGTGAPKVVIVNEAFTKRYARAGHLLGKHLAFGAGDKIVLDREIVGIVSDSKYSSLRKDPGPFMYIPIGQDAQLNRATFYVRTSRKESDLGPEVRSLVRGMDANLPVFDMRAMKVQIGDSIYRDRLIALLATVFGALATLLASIGLYGVVAFNVARRTAEMGLRMALGALPGDVLRLVMKEVGALLTAGALIGLASGLGFSRYIESQLFGMKANDPMTFCAAAAVLALATGLAGYIPARRAAKTDPIKALRYE